MLSNRMLSILICSLIAGCCAMGCLMLGRTDPRWLQIHLASVAVGTGAMILIANLGWRRLTSAVGLVFAGTVGLLCLYAILQNNPYKGAAVYVSFMRKYLFNPVFLIPPACVVLYACFSQTANRVLAFPVTVITIGITCFMINGETIRTILFLLCALIWFVYPDLDRRSRLLKCLPVWLFVGLMAGVSFMRIHRLLEPRWLNKYYHGLYSDAPWFGSYGSIIPNGIPEGPWTDSLNQAFLVLGKWAIPMMAMLTLGLTACLVLAVVRAKGSVRRLLALGGTLCLAVPMLSSFTQFFFGLPSGFIHFPFLSLGGVLTCSAFVSLGLVLISLRDDDDSREPAGKTCTTTMVIALALLCSTATAIGVASLHDYLSEPARIQRILPEPESGFYYDIPNAIRVKDIVYAPYVRRTASCEPKVVVALHKCRGRQLLAAEGLNREPPVINAQCGLSPGGDVLCTCSDLYKMNFLATPAAFDANGKDR
mgnify:CR=1 FL=1